MSDEAAFLRAIQANPADATAKLVYADWLDEHGEPERAEYLRLLASGASASHLERKVGKEWTGWANGHFPPWDAATLHGLGRLDALLESHLAFNERASDIATHFYALLVPNNQHLDDLCRYHCLHAPGSVDTEPISNWQESLKILLASWLFVHRETVPASPQHRIDTPGGRTDAVVRVLDAICEVLRPRRAWWVRFHPQNFFALSWADVALETDDRVLFLHFSFSD